MNINLPPELESTLNSEADKLGVPLSDYVAGLLEKRRGCQQPTGDGAAVVEYWRKEGLIGTRADKTDSQALARELRENAQRRNGR